jgi:hypothetical protein
MADGAPGTAAQPSKASSVVATHALGLAQASRYHGFPWPGDPVIARLHGGRRSTDRWSRPRRGRLRRSASASFFIDLLGDPGLAGCPLELGARDFRAEYRSVVRRWPWQFRSSIRR